MEKLILNSLKQHFLDKQANLIAHLRPNDEPSLDGGDEIDKIQLAQLKNISSGILKQKLDMLISVNNAISKIENGTFGRCEECEELIGEKRLIALPYCKLCISCQEQEELEIKQFARNSD